MTAKVIRRKVEAWAHREREVSGAAYKEAASRFYREVCHTAERVPAGYMPKGIGSFHGVYLQDNRQVTRCREETLRCKWFQRKGGWGCKHPECPWAKQDSADNEEGHG